MKTKTKEYTIFILYTLIIAYIAIAFIVGELDPACWGIDARAAFVFIVALTTGIKALTTIHN